MLNDLSVFHPEDIDEGLSSIRGIDFEMHMQENQISICTAANDLSLRVRITLEETIEKIDKCLFPSGRRGL